jgi:diketogulonate reductase-like aldo/keto reductase
MSKTPLVDPVAQSIAAAHGVSVASVTLAWQWQARSLLRFAALKQNAIAVPMQLGFVTNPRSQNAAHAVENLAALEVRIPGAAMCAILDSIM